MSIRTYFLVPKPQFNLQVVEHFEHIEAPVIIKISNNLRSTRLFQSRLGSAAALHARERREIKTGHGYLVTTAAS